MITLYNKPYCNIITQYTSTTNSYIINICRYEVQQDSTTSKKDKSIDELDWANELSIDNKYFKALDKHVRSVYEILEPSQLNLKNDFVLPEPLTSI